MSELSIDETFKTCYEKFDTYPTNLIYKTSYHTTLERQRKRLALEESKLFAPEKHLDIGFRDFDFKGSKDARNIQTMAELKRRLGDESKADPDDDKRTREMISKADPRCRFIFFWAPHSRTALKVTRAAFAQILSYHQVHPSYLDFVSVFGRQIEHQELRFSGFRAQKFLDKVSDSQTQVGRRNAELSNTGEPVPGQTAARFHATPAVSALGRSGRCIQLSWNLKTVVNNSTRGKAEHRDDWSIRQAAFYHQFDVENGNTLWIATSGGDDIQSRVEDHTGLDARPEDVNFDTPKSSFRSSLSVHQLFCNWSTEGWRGHLGWLEQTIAKRTDPAILGTRDAAADRVEYASADLQQIQGWEDYVQDVAVVLDANSEVMISLRNLYRDLQDNVDFPLKDACRKDLISFLAKAADCIADLKLQAARAKALAERTASRKTLVVQHLQSQAAEEMKLFAKGSQREAIAMRVIAVVTVLYLPATFVSTFFSTDVVKYQDQNGDDDGQGRFSYPALMRWLQVSVPLTFITLFGVVFWYMWANGRLKRWRAACRAWGSRLQRRIPGRHKGQ